MIHALSWLGRHGSILLALGVFLGLLLPSLASLLKPLLIPGIIGPFLIALIRLDWARFTDHLQRPQTTVLVLLWLLLLAPLLVHNLLGLLPLDPNLHANLVLMASASPLMASASLALIIGLDAALAVVLTFLATALLPFTLPPIALYLLGIDINITIDELMLRLGLLIGGCFALAWLIRRYLPIGFADRHAAPLDGLAIIGLLVFAIAIMDGVTVLLLDRPEIVLTTALAVFALNLGLQAIATLAFAWRGLKTALSVGLCSGNRNLGILLAAIADRATADLLIVVALAQLPIYTLPMLQRWLYRRWLARPAALLDLNNIERSDMMTTPGDQAIQELLVFWFSDDTKARWYDSTPAFDILCRDRFGALVERAARDELQAWEDTADGTLALCLLLDQMPRNIYRGSLRAFEADPKAVGLASRAIDKGFDQELDIERRKFLYLPFMHSEVLAEQERSVVLSRMLNDKNTLAYAEDHEDIIRCFGRFPHRNAILGRESTKAEQTFLADGAKDYGQSTNKA